MRYLLTLLLLFVSTYAKSNDYSIIIKEPFDNALFDVTQDYDRSISAIGFIRKYKISPRFKYTSYSNPFDYLSDISNSHSPQMHLIKLNRDDATIILRKTANLSKFNKAVSLVKTPNNGYFVGGYTMDGSLLLIKLNSNGEFIFEKEFGTKNYDRMNNLILLSDGGVLAVGSSITTRSQNDDMFETGLGLNDIYLARFSKDGEKLWSHKYGTKYDDRGIDAVEANDGSIIVLCQTKHGRSKHITLMRVTQNGNKIWLKHYKNEKNSIPYKVIKLRNNNFVASMTVFDDMGKEQVRLIKFNLQKNILLDKTIFTTYASALKDIKEYANSNIIGVGYARDSYNTDGLVMLFDSNFELLHQEHFGGENYEEFNAVTILDNSQVALVGIHTSEKSQESKMWIVKLNQDLSIAQLSIKKNDLYKNLKQLFKKEMASKKIEIKENLTINFIDKNLYFKTSKYKLNKRQKEFFKNFGTKLFKFLQKNRNFVSTLEINGHTSSEWGKLDFTKRYLKNEKLSYNRAYSILSFMFKNQDLTTQKFLSKILKSSALSYSKKRSFKKTEDKEKSRRVSFKIIISQR